MAAIDKIYLTSFDTFVEFKNWCEAQPLITDKYGKEERISDYLFMQWYDPKYWKDNKEHPVMNAPIYIDAYIIRNCPIEEVQRELQLNYGYWSQERIKSFYEDVKNWDPAKGKCPYWATLDDFNINEDGSIITFKNPKKSDYEMIKDSELYASPACDKYECGKHFKIVKIPTLYKGHKCNYPIPYKKHTPSWFVDVKLPDYVEEKYMSWSSHSAAKFPVGTWDFIFEYVNSYDGWSSSTTNCKSIRSLTRRINKWNLPVGTIITVTGRYIDEKYEIIVKK